MMQRLVAGSARRVRSIVNRKLVQVLLVVVAAGAGFALGHRRDVRESVPARQIAYWVDPMHPSYRSDKPGTAPDCGMKLVPVYADERGTQMAGSQHIPPIRISPGAQQLYGIRLARAEKTAGVHTVRAFGRVAADETRIYTVNVAAGGYIRETANDAVGDYVTKGQHLAVFYSPDFLALIGGYLSANERTPGGVSSNIIAAQNAASVHARADRLRTMGMSDEQIEEIARTGKIPEYVYIASPANGFILTRTISPGQRFDGRTDFYTIADLAQVWIEAEVSARDARAFVPGAMAHVSLPDTGQMFTARVSHVVPEIDPSTRALKVRLVAENPRFALRPEMYVNVDMPISMQPALTVPVDALLNSGLTNRIFVADGEGWFEPRDVQTGWTLEDRVQIVQGLREGEMVAASGTFLIDSESRLQTPIPQLTIRPVSSDRNHAD